MERINTNTVSIDSITATVSTVKFDNGNYETIVMLADGDELECYTSRTIAEAEQKHIEIVNKYNSKKQ